MLAASAEAGIAAARVCRQLESQLSAASDGGGSSNRYDRAAAKQRDELSKARRQARGCGRLFGGRKGCDSLNATIKRMERNLASLERKGNDGGKPSRAERARIMAALGSNGCRGEQTARRSPSGGNDSDRPTSLFARLFGDEPAARGKPDDDVRRILRRGDDRDGDNRPRFDPRYYSKQRSFCVRTCDGYYFPLSFSSTRSDLDRDQNNCQAACPGAEMQVYFGGDDEAAENMTSSATGEPYSTLPTAFLYRQAGAPAAETCGCSPSKNFSIIAGEPSVETPPEAVAEPVIPLPSGRPDPGADPETLANADGKLDAAAIRRIIAAKPATGGPAPVERRIRVVGPAYLPDPEAARDLQVPGPTATP
jgi:hypothetical protein